MERHDSTSENPCPVCHDTIHFYAVGPCDHPVCHKCSTRMRVLCEQMDCPICRSTMPQVAFIYEKMLFKDLNLRDCIPNRKNKIFYESEEIEDSYLDLLEFRCRHCPKRKAERTFAQLQTHMRRDHQLFACDICLAHLKIFPYETKFYDRKSLAVHRRMGDEDDKSYKGHPLCEFCDTRYLDKDELMKHLRKDHYFCHFCDQEGSNAYYNEYADLHMHFGESHFLCKEDECGNPSTRFTHAFSSEIDLKSHRATVHNNKSKQTRTIDIDFQFAPRHQGHGRGSNLTSDDYEDSGSQRQRNRGDRYGNRRRQQEDPNLQRALEASLQETAEVKPRPPVQERVPDPIHDFPTLGGAPASQTQTVTESQRPATSSSTRRVEDFPSLGSTNSNNGKKPALGNNKNYAAITHYASEPRPVAVEKVKESKPVSLGTIKAAAKERWASQAPKVTEDDYPTLAGKSNNKPSHQRPSSASGGTSSTSWLQKPTVSEVPPSSSAVPTISIIMDKPNDPVPKARHSVPVMRPISDERDFPSLGGGATRQENIPMSNPLWSKPKANITSKRPNHTPKSEKVVDESFEIPDSYYSKSYYENQQAKEKGKGDNKKETVVNKKDFPGLPKREVENRPPNKVVNNNDKSGGGKKIDLKLDGDAGGKKSKKSKKGPTDKSLNDIAAGLVDTGSVNFKVGGSGKKGGKSQMDENGNNPKSGNKTMTTKVTKPDWFDNPPILQEVCNTKESVKVSVSSSSSRDSETKPDNSFPSLHSMSPSVQTSSSNAPPGFSSPSPFSSQPSKPKSISAPPGFSKAAPPGLSSSPLSLHNYVQPAGFSARNQALVQTIRSCLEYIQDGFDNFKSLSFQFRGNKINANLYYTNCQMLIGESDFKTIFPELLALLPDIGKQQELWLEHQVNITSSKGKGGGSGKSMCPCSKCGQIVLKEDSQHHNLQHGDEKDFPSLIGGAAGKDSNGNASLKGTWIKAT